MCCNAFVEIKTSTKTSITRCVWCTHCTWIIQSSIITPFLHDVVHFFLCICLSCFIAVLNFLPPFLHYWYSFVAFYFHAALSFARDFHSQSKEKIEDAEFSSRRAYVSNLHTLFRLLWIDNRRSLRSVFYIGSAIFIRAVYHFHYLCTRSWQYTLKER